MAVIVNPTLADRLAYVETRLDHLGRVGQLSSAIAQGTEEALEATARVLAEPQSWDQPTDCMDAHAAYVRAMLALERAAALSEAGDKEAALAHVVDFTASLGHATTALARQRLGQSVN